MNRQHPIIRLYFTVPQHPKNTLYHTLNTLYNTISHCVLLSPASAMSFYILYVYVRKGDSSCEPQTGCSGGSRAGAISGQSRAQAFRRSLFLFVCGWVASNDPSVRGTASCCREESCTIAFPHISRGAATCIIDPDLQ